MPSPETDPAAPILNLVHGRSYAALHGELLRSYLQAAELDVPAFMRLLHRAPNYRHHGAEVVEQWLSGERIPGSPIPLLIAMREAARRTGRISTEVAELLRGA